MSQTGRQSYLPRVALVTSLIGLIEPVIHFAVGLPARYYRINVDACITSLLVTAAAVTLALIARRRMARNGDYRESALTTVTLFIAQLVLCPLGDRLRLMVGSHPPVTAPEKLPSSFGTRNIRNASDL